MSKISEALKERIKNSGLTMRAIDAGCGVAPSSISRFMAGKGISLASAEKLTNFFNDLDRKKARAAKAAGAQQVADGA